MTTLKKGKGLRGEVYLNLNKIRFSTDHSWLWPVISLYTQAICTCACICMHAHVLPFTCVFSLKDRRVMAHCWKHFSVFITRQQCKKPTVSFEDYHALF